MPIFILRLKSSHKRSIMKRISCKAGGFIDYITITEASQKWGVSTRAILYQVADGRIEGAEKKGNLWLIPVSASKPEDLRKYNRRHPRKEGNV